MKKKDFLIVLAITAVIILAVIIVRNRANPTSNSFYNTSNTPTTNGENETSTPTQTVAVTAQNKKFSPSDFSMDHLDSVLLTITAVDADYTFNVVDYPRMDTKIAKGTTQTVRIDRLGVGSYTYSCGTGCSGKITVTQKLDTED